MKYLYLKWIKHGKVKNILLNAMYYDKKKTIAVEYKLNTPVPRKLEESISRMRYITNVVEQLYTYLWNNIRKKDYITFK